MLLFTAELAELLRVHDLAIGQRREREAGGRAQQRDAVGRRALAQGLEGVLLALVELGVDAAQAVAVLVGVERRRNGLAQLLDPLRHVVTQLRAAAGGQAQRDRPLGVSEVVGVAPVLRLAVRGACTFEQPGDQRAATQSGRTDHEQVVAGLADADTELDGFAGALLPEDGVTGVQLRCGGKSELRGVAGAAHLRCRERRDRHPMGSPVRRTAAVRTPLPAPRNGPTRLLWSLPGFYVLRDSARRRKASSCATSSPWVFSENA